MRLYECWVPSGGRLQGIMLRVVRTWIPGSCEPRSVLQHYRVQLLGFNF